MENFKGLLQEYCQQHNLPVPLYSTLREGEDHIPSFISTVHIGSMIIPGEKRSKKKDSEQSAAEKAIASFSKKSKTLIIDVDKFPINNEFSNFDTYIFSESDLVLNNVTTIPYLNRVSFISYLIGVKDEIHFLVDPELQTELNILINYFRKDKIYFFI